MGLLNRLIGGLRAPFWKDSIARSGQSAAGHALICSRRWAPSQPPQVSEPERDEMRGRLHNRQWPRLNFHSAFANRGTDGVGIARRVYE
jgi:hypothetical protein